MTDNKNPKPAAKSKKKKFRLNKKKFAILLGLFIIVTYIVFQICSISSASVKTETASNLVLKDTINAQGIVIRNEKPILYNENGVLSFLIDDGCRVANNGTIAKIYKNDEDKKIKCDIEKLDGEIARLNELNNRVQSMSITSEALNKRISLNIKELLLDFSDKNYLETEETKNNLLYLLDTKQTMAGNFTNCQDKIDELTEQRRALLNKSYESIGSLISDSSGYFISQTDGYENIWDYKNISSLNVENIKNLLSLKNEKQDNAIGKVVCDTTWYIACAIPTKKAESLSLGQPVEIDLPFASTESIPCEIAFINLENSKDESTVIFSCSRINKALLLIRNEEIKINLETHKGIGFRKSALHEGLVEKEVEDENGNITTEEKKVKGVYVLYGSSLVFKEVKIIYSSDRYILCDPSPLENEIFSKSTIKPFDEIVVNGTNLYDGKIIKY